MAIEMVLKYILCSAVLLLIAPTTFANEPFPPTEVEERVDGLAYRTTYSSEESCDFSSRYRTIDGSCNNRDNPLRGRAFTPFQRFLQPDYSYFSSQKNPSLDSRSLSQTFFENNTNESLEKEVTDFFVVATQIILHDMALGQRNHEAVRCCPSPTNTTECMPDLYLNSPIANTHNPACHNFVRNLGVGNIAGIYGPREQLNRVTHYLDGSVIYGSSQEELDFLREPNSAKMRVTNVGNNPLLPTDDTATPPNNCPFFRAGDQRVSAVISVTPHHIFWMREHNFIVDGLLRLNISWDHEILFQEARKIVIAEFQHTAYKLLPLLLGKSHMDRYRLRDEFDYVYDSNIDGSTSNAYTAAAFRQAHLMLDDVILYDQKGRDSSRRNTTGICTSGIDSLSCYSAPTMTLADALISPDRLYSCQNSVDALIMGSIKKRAQIANDNKVAKTLKGFGDGLDLIGVDIERGRDHGLPSYTAWRNFCGLSAFTFSSNSNTHRSDILGKLKSVYKTETNIDLLLGGSFENKLEDAVLGPTFACIIARQMHATKYGDRFWYQNEGIFTNEQLQEIRRQTMSMILKRNTNISKVPVNPFVFPNEATKYQIDDTFNFKAWENQPDMYDSLYYD